MMKTHLFFVFFTLSNLIYSQQKDIDKVTFYLNKSNEVNGTNVLKALEYAKKASLIAEKINHSERKATSYLFIAKCLYILNSYKDSFVYIEKGLREKETYKDEILLSSFKEITASNYFATGLDEQGLKEYEDIIKLLKNNNDKESVMILSRTYAMIASIYLSQNKFDLSYINIDKAIKTNMKVTTEGNADLYNIKGYALMYDKKTDSALHYFNKSYEETKNGTFVNRYVQFTAFGDYYYEIKQYEKSLGYYLKALADLKKFGLDDAEFTHETNKNIYEIYDILKNPKKKNEYLARYLKESEILKGREKENFQASVNAILNRKSEEISFFKKRSHVTILSLILASMLIVFFVYIRLKNRNKNALQKAEKALSIKQEIIQQKEDEYKNLEYKVNDAFEQVLQLAKTNDPSFLARFKEVYPEFCKKLITLYPDILTSEFTFCAYLKLNFSTKEIANYTFVTQKAVESRKSRIRKKLKISSDTDLYVWFNKI